jgi:putative FmdB family regulatory protein
MHGVFRFGASEPQGDAGAGSGACNLTARDLEGGVGPATVKIEFGMPLYEYKCHSCGKIFEVIQKFSDEPLKTHPECGGEVERLISRSAFQLKGSGWYATDYAKGNSGSSSDSKPADSAKTDTKPETKSDSKTESKPAPASSTDSKS